MAKKYNYGKITGVVFLTILIWVWADLALDDEFSVSSAVISVAKSTSPNLWVTFNSETLTSVQRMVLKEVVLKGPVSTITTISGKLKEGEKLDFDFDAAREKMGQPGPYTLDLLPFLQKNKELKEMGLQVDSCDPNTISVNVLRLVQKSLTVECLDENGVSLKAESIEPEKVDMFVPEKWTTEELKAYVKLTQREIKRARLSPVQKAPYIVLAPGQTREVPETVEIRTSPHDDQLTDHLITTATLAVALSPTMQEKYDVRITNYDTVIGAAIAIRATADARRAYQMQQFPSMTLYILDGDEKVQIEQKREVVYNFPEEFVRKNEIELKNPQPVVAKFILVPRTPARNQ